MNGTEIQNSASIYFSPNPPIKTNTTIHTINEPFFTITIDKKIIEYLKIKVYPNPTEGIIYIDKGDNQKVNFLLSDNLGRVIIADKTNEKISTINIRNLKSGIYYLTINNGKRIATQKIVKQ